jgi:hypothetical protein
MKKVINPLLVGLSIFFAVVGLVAVFYFIFSTPFNDWSWQPNSSLFSDYGSFIGGFAGSLFSLAGFVLLYLTLRAQQEDMNIQKRSAERDRFENRFFELLKIHKDNSNVIIQSIFESEDGIGFGEEAARRQWETTKKRGFEYLVKRINNHYEERRKSREVKEETKESKHDTFLWVYNCEWRDSFGHYFRHLFLLVKFVVKRNDLSYEEKRDYLRIVRASLSTYEQVFLYYNWLADIGKPWEEESENGNKFFTDYRMIHNISPVLLISEFTFTKISPFKELLNSKAYKQETGKTDDCLFEQEGWNDWEGRNNMPPHKLQ